jgi:hypothetical protein
MIQEASSCEFAPISKHGNMPIWRLKLYLHGLRRQVASVFAPIAREEMSDCRWRRDSNAIHATRHGFDRSNATWQ